LPNNSHVLATHAGTVKFTEHLMFFNVLYIPEFSFNLISVQRLIGDFDCELIFSCKSCQIQDKGTSKMIGRAELNKDLYYLQHFSGNSNQVFVNNVLQYKGLDSDMWHFRLGHPSNRILDILCKKFPYIRADSKHICDVFHFTKQHKLPYQLSNSSTATAFSLIHVDIWGPFSLTFVHGHRFFLIIVVDHTRHTWIYLMKSKSETRSLFLNFIIYVKNQFHYAVKIIRTDNGKEFEYDELYDKFGILHQRTCIETPQQNSVVERKHQHILNVTHSLMFQSGLSKLY